MQPYGTDATKVIQVRTSITKYCTIRCAGSWHSPTTRSFYNIKIVYFFVLLDRVENFLNSTKYIHDGETKISCIIPKVPAPRILYYGLGLDIHIRRIQWRFLCHAWIVHNNNRRCQRKTRLLFGRGRHRRIGTAGRTGDSCRVGTR